MVGAILDLQIDTFSRTQVHRDCGCDRWKNYDTCAPQLEHKMMA